MKIDTKTGLLDVATFKPSPNCDERPRESEDSTRAHTGNSTRNNSGISLLVIHNISLPPGQFGGPYIEQLFCNQLDPEAHPFFQEIFKLRVSSHLLIRRSGDIIQYVPFNKRAWHAGVSEFNKKTCCNNFSIGIEMEGTDTDEYEETQYQKLTEITEHILEAD